MVSERELAAYDRMAWAERAALRWADRLDVDAPWRDPRQKPWTGDVRDLLKMAIVEAIEESAAVIAGRRIGPSTPWPQEVLEAQAKVVRETLLQPPRPKG